MLIADEPNYGLCITALRERVEVLRGNIQFVSESGGASHLAVVLPLENFSL